MRMAARNARNHTAHRTRARRQPRSLRSDLRTPLSRAAPERQAPRSRCGRRTRPGCRPSRHEPIRPKRKSKPPRPRPCKGSSNRSSMPTPNSRPIRKQRPQPPRANCSTGVPSGSPRNSRRYRKQGRAFMRCWPRCVAACFSSSVRWRCFNWPQSWQRGSMGGAARRPWRSCWQPMPSPAIASHRSADRDAARMKIETGLSRL